MLEGVAVGWQRVCLGDFLLQGMGCRLRPSLMMWLLWVWCAQIVQGLLQVQLVLGSAGLLPRACFPYVHVQFLATLFFLPPK